MAAVTEVQYNSILEYIQKKLLEKQGFLESVDKNNIKDLQEICKYSEWKEVKKLRVKKVVVSENTDWVKFWATWPNTKSIPGTQMISGAKLKGAEAAMHKKWLDAVQSQKISIEQMQYAADCYLQWAYEDSKRLGRNELQYRNGMEPWFNQELYLIYKDMQMPTALQVKKVQQSADIDI